MELQSRLDQWIKSTGGTGLIGVIADGAFGSNTQVALATFQRMNGLSPSGYADGDTLETLGLGAETEADSIVFTTEGGGV
ncbi:MAG: peptidoglycan-binding protein [Myxococcales bacterium]|nr:peptidoglycan-binding protein [Myxococcales bacterium]